MREQAPRSVRGAFSFMLSVGALAGCTGAIEDASLAGGSGPGTIPGSGGTGGVHQSRGNGPPSPDTGLWRLTRTEYNNTIRDLLGDTSFAGNALPPDSTFNGFDNNSDVLKLSVLQIDKYDAVASDVVEHAFAAGSAIRAKLVTCDLATGGVPCARSIISAFARRAWRRPVTAEEADGLMTALDDARAQGDGIEEGVKLAFRSVLVSPNFLYRVEVDPAPVAKGLHPVSPHELATRLSYFVWSSTPDDRLSQLADDGSLGRPEVFTAELARLLGDAKKSDALVTNFAAQWLNTGALESVAPDPKVFHIQSFDQDLRHAMMAESQSFFRVFLKEDRNIADVLDADFTFANARLATYYGLPNVTGTNMRQVPVDGATTHRFGLLSQAGFLTLTSVPVRTVPTTRGKWVLSRLLCQPPLPKPANVPPLADAVKSAPLPANATIRDKMEVVDKNPCTGACHPIMDPVGFALEHYDGIGRWRDAYPDNKINASGQLGGHSFDGAQELSKVVKTDPRFMRCFATTVFAYALGRDPKTEGDQAAIDELTADFTQRGGLVREIIALVGSSPAFQLRGAQQ